VLRADERRFPSPLPPPQPPRVPARLWALGLGQHAWGGASGICSLSGDFAGEVVESPSLEMFKTRLDAVLRSLLWVTLLGQGVGLGDPQRSLPTPTILSFCVIL